MHRCEADLRGLLQVAGWVWRGGQEEAVQGTAEDVGPVEVPEVPG